MTKKGFTLIELLVVIAIIGLLSTLAVAALGSVRQKARDSKRVADLKQVQAALEMYFNDASDYPTQEGNLGSDQLACLNSAGWQTTGCASAYMDAVPKDPGSTQYVYDHGDKTYTITAVSEGTVNGMSENIKLTPSGIVDVAEVEEE